MLEPKIKAGQAPSIPENRRFGLIFATIFLVAGLYMLFAGTPVWGWSFTALASLLCISAFSKPDFLQPLNRLWFAFGTVLGRLISPLVLSIVYFLFFTPIALFQRMAGRDILHLRTHNQSSYWKEPETRERPYRGFRDQF